MSINSDKELLKEVVEILGEEKFTKVATILNDCPHIYDEDHFCNSECTKCFLQFIKSCFTIQI